MPYGVLGSGISCTVHGRVSAEGPLTEINDCGSQLDEKTLAGYEHAGLRDHGSNNQEGDERAAGIFLRLEEAGARNRARFVGTLPAKFARKQAGS